MKTAKEQVRELLEALPDDVSLEEIQYHIAVRQRIERGLEQVEAGEVIDQEDVEKRMARWQDGENG